LAGQAILLTHVSCAVEVAELDGVVQIVQADPTQVMVVVVVGMVEE
jgi:hypothetical protein